MLDLPFWQVRANVYCSDGICCTVTVWFGRLGEDLLGDVEPVLDIPFWQVRVSEDFGQIV